MKTANVWLWITGIALLGLTACTVSKEDIETLKQQNQEILSRLEKIEERLQPARRAERPAEDFDKVYDIAIADSPIRGKADAPVTIVEFSDFQCPFCAQAQTILEAVLAKYPDQVRLVYKHYPLPFHPAALPGAIASLAAQEQGKFWELHDVLFAEGQALDAAKMSEYAKRAGLDVERLEKSIADERAAYEKRIEEDIRAAHTADVRGTPTFFVNGKKLRMRSVDGFSQMIDAALAAK